MTTKMDYSEFMNTIMEYQRGNWYNDICSTCGGTGFEPVECCGGSYPIECGCYGLPVDFKLECSSCGRKGDGKILSDL